MTQTALEKENAALRQQIAALAQENEAALARENEAIDLAKETSARADEAVRIASVATAHLTAKPTPPPAPAAPPPPPAPVAPPPARPARLIDFLNLSPYEKARTREFYGGGDKLEAELDEADMHANRMDNIRAGHEMYQHGPTGEKGGRHVFITEYHAGDGHEDPREMAKEFRITEAKEIAAGTAAVAKQEAENAARIVATQAHFSKLSEGAFRNANPEPEPAPAPRPANLTWGHGAPKPEPDLTLNQMRGRF